MIENMVVYYPNIVNEGILDNNKKSTIYKHIKLHYKLYTLISYILFVCLLKYLMNDISFNNTYFVVTNIIYAVLF